MKKVTQHITIADELRKVIMPLITEIHDLKKEVKVLSEKLDGKTKEKTYLRTSEAMKYL